MKTFLREKLETHTFVVSLPLISNSVILVARHKAKAMQDVLPVVPPRVRRMNKLENIFVSSRRVPLDLEFLLIFLSFFILDFYKL